MKSSCSTSPQTALKLNHTALLRITGYLHALALFWCFYPLAARLFLAETTFRTPFLLTGIFLLLPVILSWYAATKLKYLILYFLTGILVSLGYGAFHGFLGSLLDLPLPLATGLSLSGSLLLFFIRGLGRIKKGQVQKMLLELPSADLTRVDYSELEVPVFLDTPSPLHWIYFALHYVLGALLKAPFYWHMIFYLFLADVFLCFIYRFVDGFYDFLKEHSHYANLPVRTMEKVVRIIFAIACVILLAFTLPSLFYGKEPLSTLNFEPKQASQEWAPEPESFSPENGMPDWLEALSGEDEPKEPPKWLVLLSQVLFYLICTGAVAAILVIIYRACRKAGKFFASGTEDEICFIEKGFNDQGKELKKQRFPWFKETSANMRIRKYYKKYLRKGLKQRPAGSETPHELEALAGFSKNESRSLLHNCYEKARYSKEGCSASEADELKKLTL